MNENRKVEDKEDWEGDGENEIVEVREREKSQEFVGLKRWKAYNFYYNGVV